MYDLLSSAQELVTGPWLLASGAMVGNLEGLIQAIVGKGQSRAHSVYSAAGLMHLQVSMSSTHSVK